jgi:hypothetical protein
LAAAEGVETPIAAAAGATLDRAIAAGYGDRFLPVLPGILARMIGVTIRDIDSP